jgi:imidazolonepropionase-like amidohydrolase
MKKAIHYALGLCLVTLFWVAADRMQDLGAQAQQPAALVIEGGTLIDGNGGAPARDSLIVIQGNKIASVGRKGQGNYPAGARVIKADGKFVVPGLIDAKSNYASNYGEAYLVWGVTSAIWSGGGGDAGTAERDAINHGMLAGPRLFVSFAGINGPGPDGKKQDNGIPGRYPYIVHSPQEARELAIKFFEAGADFISAGDGDGPPEIFAPIVEEAHKRGRAAVMRTVGPGTAAREAAMMDSDVLIHTGEIGVQIAKDTAKWKNYIALPPDPYADMDDAKAAQMIKLLVDHKTALEPDLIAADRGFSKNWTRVQRENANFFTDKTLLAYFPLLQIKGFIENAKSPDTYLMPAEIDLRTQGFRNHVAFLKRFVDAGGRIVPASDIPQSPPGFGVHQEMAVFQEDVGLSPMQVLQSATKWASESFKLKDLGTIEAGKLADIVIVNADPTQDILNLRKIDSVIKDGKVQDRTYHASYLDRTFKAGLYKGGSCCFSSPVVEGGAWVAALKQATWRPNSLNGGFAGAGGLDTENSPTPGIESLMPYVVNQGSPTTTLTLKGFNFVRGSRVYLDNQAVPTKVISRTELQATVDATILAKAAKYAVTVKNPAPIAPFEWGDTSNQANLLVPYKFTTQHSQNKF